MSDDRIILRRRELRMTIIPNLPNRNMQEDGSPRINDLAPDVRRMARRFLHSKKGAGDLAKRVILRAKCELPSGQDRDVLRLQVFRIMCEIFIADVAASRGRKLNV
jgi:DNA-directed RNA polymerase specialized sigma24 family protein